MTNQSPKIKEAVKEVSLELRKFGRKAFEAFNKLADQLNKSINKLNKKNKGLTAQKGHVKTHEEEKKPSHRGPSR